MNEQRRRLSPQAPWKKDILREQRIIQISIEPTPNADLADRATTEAERQLELRTRDRQRRAISKVDSRCDA
jgi:DnaK suppressor protein